MEKTKNNLDEKFADSGHMLIKAYLEENCRREQIPLKEFIRSFERDLLIHALKLSHGNQRVASFILGMKPTTLNEKIKSFKIDEYRRKNRKLTRSELLKQIDLSSIL